MALVRKDLGLPDEAGVTELLTRHRRRVMLGAALLITAGGAAGWFVFDKLSERDAAVTATLAARDSEREAELREVVRVQERRWAEERHALDEARLAWEAEHEKLRADRASLEAAIGQLERAEAADRTELSNLRQQLVQTNETLETIGVDLGFCDGFHFSKSFKRVAGVSPRDYRAMIREP